MTSDSDIQSDAGTNNDDEFSIMSNLDSDFDMTEDNSLRTPSWMKSYSSPDSSVRDRSDDRSISPKKCQGNQKSSSTIPDCTDSSTSPEKQNDVVIKKRVLDISFSSEKEESNYD